MAAPPETTLLLTAATAGDQSAAERLTPQIYAQLRALAERCLCGEPGHTLQPTALVHEAFLKLVDRSDLDVRSQTHFYALAATAMRQVLLDHLRGRQTHKRGGSWQRVALTDDMVITQGPQVDLLDLDEILLRLADLDPRAAKVVELRFFGGLSEPEAAAFLNVSERTVRNDWNMARAWLRCALNSNQDSTSRPADKVDS